MRQNTQSDRKTRAPGRGPGRIAILSDGRNWLPFVTTAPQPVPAGFPLLPRARRGVGPGAPLGGAHRGRRSQYQAPGHGLKAAPATPKSLAGDKRGSAQGRGRGRRTQGSSATPVARAFWPGDRNPSGGFYVRTARLRSDLINKKFSIVHILCNLYIYYPSPVASCAFSI